MADEIVLNGIFKNHTMYGPHFNKVKGRFFMTVTTPDGSKTTMSYAKFVWVNTYGKLPPDGYEIDHINNDRTDNRIENLQCITSEENNLKYINARRTVYIKLCCPECEKIFI